MTTRSLILHPHEVRAALVWILGLVVRPVKGLGGIDFTSVRLSSFNSLWGPDAWIFEAPMDKEATGFEAVSRGLQCPLGVHGDRLVCKESYRRADENCADGIFYPDSTLLRWFDGNEPEIARKQILEWPRNGVNRSPATMPAWASRITLEVVGVRCVRLESLTNMDAINTGIPGYLSQFKRRPYTEYEDDLWRNSTTLENMRRFWESKYGTRYPWETSWVWAVEVRRVEG